jgi:hypothetical protein
VVRDWLVKNVGPVIEANIDGQKELITWRAQREGGVTSVLGASYRALAQTPPEVHRACLERDTQRLLEDLKLRPKTQLMLAIDDGKLVIEHVPPSQVPSP